MPTAINKIVDNFPFPPISPIVGSPNYETIAKIHLRFHSNAVSVQYNLVCDTLRLLHLTVIATMYATISATAFIALVNPGAKPTIQYIASGPNITNPSYAHDVDTVVSNKYNCNEKALQQKLIAAIDEMFIRPLRHRYMGYRTTTTCTILDHLYTTYANISFADLQDNDA